MMGVKCLGTSVIVLVTGLTSRECYLLETLVGARGREPVHEVHRLSRFTDLCDFVQHVSVACARLRYGVSTIE